MIDFNNKKVFKLTPEHIENVNKIVLSILLSDENIIAAFQSFRDSVVFTNKRIIAVNAQGVTGIKKDITSLPYSKIQTFSIETAGALDLDSELELWFSGLGKVKFEFVRSANVTELCKLISEHIL